MLFRDGGGQQSTQETKPLGVLEDVRAGGTAVVLRPERQRWRNHTADVPQFLFLSLSLFISVSPFPFLF